MDEPTVNAAVAIFVRVDVDEPERQNCCGDNGIERFGACSLSIGDKSGQQVCNVIMTCADMVRDRISGLPVMNPDKAALRSKTEFHEARITDHDALKTVEFGEGDGVAARLCNRLTPPRRSGARRLFALDRKR